MIILDYYRGTVNVKIYYDDYDHPGKSESGHAFTFTFNKY